MNIGQTAKQQGFTLIEVMIAMAIFALLSMLAYQILSASVKNSEMAEQHTARLTEIQNAFSQLERDLIQILPRQNDEKAALLSTTETSVRFTTLGSFSAAVPLSASDLTQVDWTFSEHALIRSEQPLPALSPTDTSSFLSRKMLTGVTSLHWRFYSQNWTESWSNSRSFPKAIEVVVTLEDMGEIRRLFLLPDSLEKAEATTEENNTAPPPADAVPPIENKSKSTENE